MKKIIIMGLNLVYEIVYYYKIKNGEIYINFAEYYKDKVLMNLIVHTLRHEFNTKTFVFTKTRDETFKKDILRIPYTDYIDYKLDYERKKKN